MAQINCLEIESKIYSTILESKDLFKDIKLVILDLGSNAASKKYIALKIAKAQSLGINAELMQFSNETGLEKILTTIDLLNKDNSVTGIMVQLPMFSEFMVNKHRILNAINPIKDVDGLSAINLGLFSQNVLNGILPATVDAVLEVLKLKINNFESKNILIINNSDLIGKPLANILSTLNATVTIANEFTNNLNDLLKQNTVIITATGKGNLFNSKDLLNNSLIIDVTTTFVNSKLIGDFSLENLNATIDYTPVPKGIGPLTIACLFRNLINLKKIQSN